MSTSLAGPPTGLLRNLTQLQHIPFAALLTVGTVQDWRGEGPRVPLALAVLAVAGWYAAGTRRSWHRQGSGRETGRHAVAWLLVLALLWAGAAVIAPALVWVAFALWLLAGHLLTLRWALVFTVAVLAVVVLGPPLTGQPWSIAAVVGPTVGAVFALALPRGQVLLARDALDRARLVDSLLAAQAESATLQTPASPDAARGWRPHRAEPALPRHP